MLPIAGELAECLRPGCERIDIAGSIRRGKTEVKDIEIVAKPKLAVDLFGNVDIKAPHHVEVLVDRLVKAGRVEPRLRTDGKTRIGWGSKYRAILLDGSIPVDLFMVVPPAQWGAALAIRTGPGTYSKELVTKCQARGLKCKGLALHRQDGTVVETPEEEDFFRACGVPWVPPEDRK